ncbi:HAD superfamily hydrolase (TIGR01459 family) [Roseinatronobacter thiooxidans]|uniref:HAD superfamily hydrolase (TIGR01459 family) n=1 Tax=Roseinatronobacter thiooxidans TaxID=121821 RepID=A0A2W7PYR2_9RHOB|nr:TIGR01459 family HAD-type hydrolase [Roseinatronobacter thiooxidans]PZX41231.1 HAD superfamily hydrolase (TIGR01459 family) [Roseinatronobacter thiooxidans]
MVVQIGTLLQIAPRYDAIILDQWGVLHDGTTPYPAAQSALAQLHKAGVRLAVLSNSGKRAALNAARIESMGFAPEWFELVMTSGEALWQDIQTRAVTDRVFFPIEAASGDALSWSDGIEVAFTSEMSRADAVLLMGLGDAGHAHRALDEALARALPVYCTNPDRASPRAGGVTVPSPGALAHAYAAAGGTVRFYGKPHLAVFRAIERALGVAPNRLLMVGDSLEHDIAGAAAAGWHSAFIEGGLHRATFAACEDAPASLQALCHETGFALPDFTLSTLR